MALKRIMPLGSVNQRLGDRMLGVDRSQAALCAGSSDGEMTTPRLNSFCIR